MCKTQLTATPPHSYRKAQWSPASCGTLRQRSKGVLRKSGVRRRTTNGAQGSSKKRGVTFGVDASMWTHAHEDYDRSCIRVSKLHRSGKEWRDIMAAKKRNTPEYNIYCLGADTEEEEPASPLPSWDSYYASWRGRADTEEDAQGRIDAFMETSLIPLAIRTHAIVLCDALSNQNVLSASFNRISAVMCRTFGETPYAHQTHRIFWNSTHPCAVHLVAS